MKLLVVQCSKPILVLRTTALAMCCPVVSLSGMYMPVKILTRGLCSVCNKSGQLCVAYNSLSECLAASWKHASHSLLGNAHKSPRLQA